MNTQTRDSAQLQYIQRAKVITICTVITTPDETNTDLQLKEQHTYAAGTLACLITL
jgi:hypothetical protein